MARPSKLTPEQWTQLVEYYNAGHTMKECGDIWGVSMRTVSVHFKRNGIKARPRFVPSRKAKQDNMPDWHYLKATLPPQEDEKSQPEGEEPPTVQEVRPPVKRKIISLAGNGGEGRMLYEKEIA